MFFTCSFHGNSMNNLLSYCGLVDTRMRACLLMFCACSFHGNSMNNLLSYCGLMDAKIRASDKDLPVPDQKCFNLLIQ